MSPTARMIQSLAERSVSGEADSVKHTFSSWDNCMAKAYCKWPVIAVIIVGSLILLSIAGCLISCLCCGYQCCKGCCGCFYRCCDCGGGSRNHKKKRDSFGDHGAPYYQQPPPPRPMNYGHQQPAVSPAPPAYRGPRTATFDQPKATVVTNEDALPSMPTWADAQTRRVEDHTPVHETVEMDDLEAHDHANNPYYNHHSTSPAPGLMTRGGYSEVPAKSTSPHPSPQPMYHDDYLHDEGYSPGAGGLRVTNASTQDYGESDYIHHQQHQPYSPISSASSPGYGAPPARYPSPGAAAAAATIPSRMSPRPSPAAYRGFDNQAPAKVQTPNFSGPRAYDQIPSPRSPVSPPMPYSPYETHQQQQPPYQTRSPPPVAGSPVQHGQYRAFSPAISSSTPPPPFSETDHHAAAQDADRPPSLLMAGRRPAPNSYKAV